MKNQRTRLLLLLLLLATSLQLHAIPAWNLLHTYTQPDGTTFQARLHGDEHLHYVTDAEGHALVRNSDGFWCYAYFQADGRKTSSGYPVGTEAPAYVLNASRYVPGTALTLRARERRQSVEAFRARRLAKTRQAAERIRTKADGESTATNRHSIVILAEFSDTKMTFTRDNFIDMLTKEGYSYNGAHGSALDYFNEMFQGDWHFSFTVSPIITLDHDSAYYFANGEDDMDVNPAQAVADACWKAKEAGIDFSLFDDDGDSEVDNVIVFVAGKDESQGADANCVWSHAWAVRDGAGINCILDGKTINSYAITTEYGIDGNSPTGGWHYGFTGIGTVCHEFSHTFGLPDFYDTDYAGSGGYGDGLFGKIDLLDSGNINDYGRRPPHYSAIEYYLLGLGNVADISRGNHTLEPISENRRFLRYQTTHEGEYFLFECRDNTSVWDRNIGGKGLLIYHIDESGVDAGWSDAYHKNLTTTERWYFNEVNANPLHECGYLISATPGIHAKDSEGYDSGNQGKVFYPQTSYKEFSPDSDPPFILWDGSPAGLALVNIAMSGKNVTFTVQGGHIQVPDVALVNQDIFQDAAILQWTATDETYAGPAYVQWGASASQERKIEEVRPYEPGKYAVRLEGLNGTTAYKADIWFEQDGTSGKIRSANFTTKAFRGGVPYIVLASANSNGTFSSGTQIPLHVNNASGTDGVQWFLGGSTIEPGGNGYYTLTRGGTLKAVVTYTNGQKDIIIKEIKIQ